MYRQFSKCRWRGPPWRLYPEPLNAVSVAGKWLIGKMLHDPDEKRNNAVCFYDSSLCAREIRVPFPPPRSPGSSVCLLSWKGEKALPARLVAGGRREDVYGFSLGFKSQRAFILGPSEQPAWARRWLEPDGLHGFKESCPSEISMLQNHTCF